MSTSLFDLRLFVKRSTWKKLACFFLTRLGLYGNIVQSILIQYQVYSEEFESTITQTQKMEPLESRVIRCGNEKLVRIKECGFD